MKIKPEELSSKHIGMVCVIRYMSESIGTVEHSHSHGSHVGQVDVYHVLLGRICDMSGDELAFSSAFFSTEYSGVAGFFGPSYEFAEDVIFVRRSELQKNTPVVINDRENSNAVCQHLSFYSRQSGHVGEESELLIHLSQI